MIKKVKREAFLKALLNGLTAGLIAATVPKGFVKLLTIFITAAIATPLFYFFRFRPTARQIAARLDSLGLEERLLTAEQFKDDNSYIAQLQRADAERHFNALKPAMIKIRPSKLSIITLLIAATACFSAQFITIPTYTPPVIPPTYYTLTYQAGDNGSVLGATQQELAANTLSTPVYALADTDFIFAGWSDGLLSPLRQDAIAAHTSFTAFFEPVEDNELSDKSGNGDQPAEEGDSSPTVPDNSNPFPTDPSNPMPMPSTGESGNSNPSNQVIDGSTNVGDVIGSSIGDAADSMNSADIGSGESQMIGDYFNGIN